MTPPLPDEYGTLRDTILAVFKKKNTKFLTTAHILGEVRFQKGVFPKEDTEKLNFILEKMREEDLVLTNQPKFVALTGAGQAQLDLLTETRLLEIEKETQKRLSR